MALESEAIGEEVITDLGTQRETLERTRSRLQETDAELGRSRRVVRSLNSGVLKNKVVLIVIIIVEIGILIAVIIWKFFLKKTGTHLA